jgi:hypothetical protein
MTQRRIKIAALLVWLLAFICTQPVANYYDVHFQPNYKNRTLTDVMLDIFGDARTLMARYLWFKMDIMHETLDSTGIPVFRQKDLLPLMRMTTYLDPTFDDAYDTIAFDLWKGYGRTQEAFDLVMEGLKSIPNSYLLHFRAAFLAYQMQRWDVVTREARIAFPLARDKFEQLNAVRFLYHTAQKTGNWHEGMAAAEVYLQLSPTSEQVADQLKQWRKEHPGQVMK